MPFAIAGFFSSLRLFLPPRLTNEKVALEHLRQKTDQNFIKCVLFIIFNKTSQGDIHLYRGMDINASHFKMKHGRCKNQSD